MLSVKRESEIFVLTFSSEPAMYIAPPVVCAVLLLKLDFVMFKVTLVYSSMLITPPVAPAELYSRFVLCKDSVMLSHSSSTLIAPPA